MGERRRKRDFPAGSKPFFVVKLQLMIGIQNVFYFTFHIIHNK